MTVDTHSLKLEDELHIPGVKSNAYRASPFGNSLCDMPLQHCNIFYMQCWKKCVNNASINQCFSPRS